MDRSEVHRIMQDMEHSSDDAVLIKFYSATRADVKLACALICLRRGSLQEPVRNYLLSRQRPALTELILADDVSALAAMDAYGVFTSANTDAFLKEAIHSGALECTVWLLQMKARRFGFRDRDFLL